MATAVELQMGRLPLSFDWSSCGLGLFGYACHQLTSLSTDPSISDSDASCTCGRYCAMDGKLRPVYPETDLRAFLLKAQLMTHWVEPQPCWYSSLRNVTPGHTWARQHLGPTHRCLMRVSKLNEQMADRRPASADRLP